MQNEKLKKRALKFFDAKRKDIAEGLAILKAANHKPQVVEIFEKNFNRQDIPNKIIGEVRLLLRSLNTPPVDDTGEQTKNINKNIVPDAPPSPPTHDPEKEFLGNLEKELANNEYPQEVKAAITEFSNLYKKRSIFHNELKAVGEENTPEKVEKRKIIGEYINKISVRMDTLWAAIELYKSDGTIPSTELLEPKSELDNGTDDGNEEDKEIEIPTTKKELQKLQGNLRVYITKCENRLLYQSDKKLEKENPLPDCPDRIKIEKRLARYKATKEKVDYALANLS